MFGQLGGEIRWKAVMVVPPVWLSDWRSWIGGFANMPHREYCRPIPNRHCPLLHDQVIQALKNINLLTIHTLITVNPQSKNTREHSEVITSPQPILIPLFRIANQKHYTDKKNLNDKFSPCRVYDT